MADNKKNRRNNNRSNNMDEDFNPKFRKVRKKVCEKFGKGIKFALSLHPLKRDEGGETRGRRFHVMAAFWRC